MTIFINPTVDITDYKSVLTALIHKELGWKAKLTFPQVVEKMVKAELVATD